MSKQLLLGDEAIAQAALDAGLSGVYAYPGTPSTESPNIFRWHRLLPKRTSITAGALTRKLRWRLPWACPLQASVHWCA